MVGMFCVEKVVISNNVVDGNNVVKDYFAWLRLFV
jgi:hypothetical protein